MKIGLVGARGTIETIRACIDPEKIFVEFIEYPVRHEFLAGVLSDIQTELDGIIFTGETFFALANRVASAVIPWTYLKRSVNSVLCILLKATLAGCDIRRITYDLPYITRKQMAQILDERLELSKDSVVLHRYNDTQERAEFMNAIDTLPDSSPSYTDVTCAYHRKNLDSGSAAICLSSAAAVVEELVEEGYPAFWVQVTGEDILEAVNELRSRQQIYIQQIVDNHLEAVIMVSTEWTETPIPGVQEYRQIESGYQVEKHLWSFAQSVGATMEKGTDGQYILYSTKSELEIKTEGLKKMLFAEKLLSLTAVDRVTVGIGFGVSHGAAKSNAQLAYRAARKQHFSSWYIGDKTGQVQGPYLIATDCSEEDFDKIQLERIAAETYVGTAVLNDLLNAQRQYGFDVTTSGELAKFCGVSISRMNRILTKLEAAGYVSVVGSQAYADTGRPRRLIRLLFGRTS